jgi:antitoxin CcdA
VRIIAEGIMSKKSFNMSLDETLIAEAKAYKLNVSQAAAQGVRTALKAAKEAAWRVENASAIKAENEFVQKKGAFSAGGKPW